MKATPNQRDAILARGKVLVSASAGAGKTTVMIARLADILEGGADLDNVLAVTFTKKAATQMKQKLRSELISRLNTDDEQKRENVRVQLAKINTADISTIHSFCARLLRTYFYVLGIDASFDVLADGAEESAVKERVMDELFDSMYAEEDQNLYRLLSCYRRKRSDANLKRIIAEAYAKLRISPDYKDVLLNSAENTFTPEGFLRVSKELHGEIKKRIKPLIAAIDEFEAGHTPESNGEGYTAVLEDMRENLTLCLDGENLFNMPAKLTSLTKPRKRAENADYDAAFGELVEIIKKRYASVAGGIESEQCERYRFLESGGLARAFCAVLARFDSEYSRVKGEEGKLDYGDLEQLAYQLLTSGEGDVSGQIREKYKYVFVDEYQDVNPIQDCIISAVSDGDFFCVGDVKQAIYGFRGSKSRFFSEKSEEAKKSGKYIILPDNFRSAPAVIDFVNRLFGEVMKPPVSLFNYADGHAMRGGYAYPEGFEGKAELCIYDEAQLADEEAKGVYSVYGEEGGERQFTAEASAVLNLVKEALEGSFYDSDEGRVRKVETGDICVLTRKRANKSTQEIIRALTSEYPVAGAAETNICERPEIIKMINVLSYIDNSQQDVPLVAALLSPLGGLSESELIKIRVAGGTGRGAPAFRTCVETYAAKKRDALAQKLKSFAAETERLKSVADCMGAARLIDEIMATGGFAALYDSDFKLAALRRLQREAYTPTGELFLNAFLQKLKKGGYKVAAPSYLSGDCIKVMTMHASKGLEFPVVIVADIAASFKGDDREEMPLDEQFGFAPRFFDEVGRGYYPTMLRKLNKTRGDLDEIGNEVNLFYVACTRAKYSLYVLAGDAKKYSALTAPYAESYAQLFDVSCFNPRILPAAEVVKKNCESVRTIDSACADAAVYARVRGAAEYVYGFELGVELPVKSSASRLISERNDEGNFVKLFSESEGEEGDVARRTGIAYHRFLELCDFDVKDARGVHEQLVRWELDGQISGEARALIDEGKLLDILNLNAFSCLAGRELYREREFICRLPSADYLRLSAGFGGSFAAGEDDGNGVIVQGAIDLLALEKRDGRVVGARVIDYKYSASNPNKLLEKYTPQLALYKSVVCKIYGLSADAVGATIVNIRTMQQVEVPV